MMAQQDGLAAAVKELEALIIVFLFERDRVRPTCGWRSMIQSVLTLGLLKQVIQIAARRGAKSWRD
jgi:hypothetical protein